MSADLLREAAALMRERAEAAIHSPWRNDFRRVNTEVEGYGTALICSPVRNGDANHIASWHPAVALAVADWLDADATVMERHDLDTTISMAYAVARAYLGAP